MSRPIVRKSQSSRHQRRPLKATTVVQTPKRQHLNDIVRRNTGSPVNTEARRAVRTAPDRRVAGRKAVVHPAVKPKSLDGIVASRKVQTKRHVTVATSPNLRQVDTYPAKRSSPTFAHRPQVSLDGVRHKVKLSSNRPAVVQKSASRPAASVKRATVPVKRLVKPTAMTIDMIAAPGARSSGSGRHLARRPISQSLTKEKQNILMAKQQAEAVQAASQAQRPAEHPYQGYIEQKHEPARENEYHYGHLAYKRTVSKRRTPKFAMPDFLGMRLALKFAAVAIVFIGSLTGVNGFKNNMEAQAQADKVTRAAATKVIAEGPSETPLTNDMLKKHRVARELPRRLSIPKLGVNTRVLALGITERTGQPEVPDNIHDAGWYRASSKPGRVGAATLITGHVHGPTRPGVFADMKQLAVGDKVSLEAGDGTLFNYKVVKVQEYESHSTDMVVAMTPVVPGKAGLNLITHGSVLDKSTNTYQNRVIVFAALVE